MEGVGRVAAGELANAFCFIGAGGHHAGRNFFGGYCCFNDAVIAVRHARQAGLRPGHAPDPLRVDEHVVQPTGGRLLRELRAIVRRDVGGIQVDARAGRLVVAVRGRRLVVLRRRAEREAG